MNPNSQRTDGRYVLIDAMRGIACMAVVLFHAKEGHHIDMLIDAAPAWFGQMFWHGAAGVAVFFVISGFVIANSMLRDEVSGAYVGRFLLRRSLRLDPPYWAAMALAVAFGFLAARAVPGHASGLPSAYNVLLHVTYLVDLFGEPMINSVYWTLCLEIQFYLSFVLLMWLAGRLGERLGRQRARDLVLWACGPVALLWTTPYAPFHVHGLFIENWYLFLAGVLVRRALDSEARSAAMLVCVGNIALLALSFIVFGEKQHGYIGLFAATIVLLLGSTGRLKTWSGGRVLQWLGLISYSLYLTHNTITGAAFRVGYRLTGESLRTEVLWLGLVTLICCLFAWVFYLVFEKLGLRLSKLVALHTKRVVPGKVGVGLPEHLA
jgi:peptidoglycan/LPS O-acetylase OafA/YrhL